MLFTESGKPRSGSERRAGAVSELGGQASGQGRHRDCVFADGWEGAGEVTEERCVHRNEKRRPGRSKVNEIRRMKKNQTRDPHDEAKCGVHGAQSARSQGTECAKACLLQCLDRTSVDKTHEWKWPDLILPFLMVHLTT